MLIEINNKNIDPRLIDQVVQKLKKGELVALPTDSIYAIACDLKNKKGLKKLSDFKNTPLKKASFSIICENHSSISDYVKPIDRKTFKILKKNLPGAFTFILHASSIVSKLFNSNKKEIGIRMSSNNIINEIIHKLQNPIAVSSLYDNEDVLLEYFIDPFEIFQRHENTIALIVDGGKGKLIASTVVNLKDNDVEIIRQGAGVLK